MVGFGFGKTVAAWAFLSALPAMALAAETVEGALHYTHDQGARLIAVSWLQVLKQPEIRRFQPDGLGRYGYRPMEGASQDLTAGFAVAGAGPQKMVEASCCASQKRDVAVSGTRYLLEAAPASLDFQGLLADINGVRKGNAFLAH